MKLLYFFSLIILFFLVPVSGNTYYLSVLGDDAQDGKTENSAWKTFDHALSLLQVNDSLLLKRGDIFRDSADFASKGLIKMHIGAYGNPTLPKPVISASIELKGWTLWKDNIYMCDASEIINELFLNNQRMTCARYPNKGWLSVSSGMTYTSTTYLECKQLVNTSRDVNNYWKNARFHWHRWNWWDEVREVISYVKGGKFVVNYKTTNISDRPLSGFGFYLDNILAELDSVGEWYQDKTTKKVYFCSPYNDNPSLYLVEGSVRKIGMNLYLTSIKDIAFRQQTLDGLNIEDSCVVENCLFENIFFRAIHAKEYAHHCIIRNNEFYDNNNLCINWYAKNSGNGAIIENNTIKRTAVIPANQNRLYGFDQGKTDVTESWWPFNNHATAIIIWYGTNNLIRYNRIDSTGYIPISLHSSGQIVEYNVLTHSSLNLNDGSAIYVNSSNNKVRRNIISDVIGKIDHAGALNVNLCHGIWLEYIFDHRRNVVENNTVTRCSNNGMFLTCQFYDTVRGNTFYNNFKGQLELTGDEAKGINQGHVIENNIMYGINRSQPSLRFESGFHYGIIRNNFFGNPFLSNEINSSYATEQFNLMYPWVGEGNIADSQKTPDYRTWDKGEELIMDGTFDIDVSHWEADAKSPTVIVSKTNDQTLMDLSSMKIEIPAGNVFWNYQTNVKVEQEYFYELRFDYLFDDLDVSQTSTKTSNLAITVKDKNSGTLLSYSMITATTLKRKAWIVFPSKINSESISIQFSHTSGIANTIWIDNVSLKSVKAQIRNPLNESKLLYNDSLTSRNFPVGEGKWHDIYGKVVSVTTVTLEPFTSMILIRNEEDSLKGIPEEKVIIPSHKTETNESLISVYPNPVNDFLYIKNLTPGSKINMISSNGKIIQTLQCNAEFMSVDVSQLPSGLYFICILSNGEIISNKFIK